MCIRDRCTSIRANYHQGNIYRDRFWDVWQNRFEPFRDREWARRGECADCSMFRYCPVSYTHLDVYKRQDVHRVAGVG